jgi:hypothetical protein
MKSFEKHLVDKMSLMSRRLQDRLDLRNPDGKEKEPMKILHQSILERVNKLPPVERARFIKRLREIDQLCPPEMRDQQINALFETLWK